MKKHTFYFNTMQKAEWIMYLASNLPNIDQKSIQVEYKFVWWMLQYKYVVVYYYH